MRYEGTKNVIEGITLKLSRDLSSVIHDRGEEEQPNELEKYFLEKVNRMEVNDEVLEKLIGIITKEEISQILSEVDLDSSPGFDGLTYRFHLSLNVFVKC